MLWESPFAAVLFVVLSALRSGAGGDIATSTVLGVRATEAVSDDGDALVPDLVA